MIRYLNEDTSSFRDVSIKINAKVPSNKSDEDLEDLITKVFERQFGYLINGSVSIMTETTQPSDIGQYKRNKSGKSSSVKVKVRGNSGKKR